MMDLTNSEHRDKKYVKLFDIDVYGNYIFVSITNSELRKECPNCYDFFEKRDNLHSIRKNDRNSVHFYKCTACGCRIGCAIDVLLMGIQYFQFQTIVFCLQLSFQQIRACDFPCKLLTSLHCDVTCTIAQLDGHLIVLSY